MPTRDDPSGTAPGPNAPDEQLADPPAATNVAHKRHEPACSYVIGIGASAGGLEPLQEFFDHMPANSGMAFVVVQHLSPDYKSLMQELLSRHTTMAIHRVEDGMQLEPDAVYLMPPKKNIVVDGNRLRLRDQDLNRAQGPNYPINLFFESLAQNLGEQAVGVILSGTGTDGSRGIRAINEAGGLVLVQDPETAQFDGMPQSAIATNLVHCVLPPDEMAQRIHNYATNATPGPGLPAVHTRLIGEERLARITMVLKRELGVDFSHYKPTTLARRVERRMLIGHYPDIPTYLQRLEESPEERVALRNDLLISVTSFFRDPTSWDLLGQSVLPEIIKELPTSEPLRAWVTACATGEEVYSLVMLAFEQFELLGRPANIKIFATDIDANALERAAAGLYPESIAPDVGNSRLRRFFEKRGDKYQISRAVREKVIFAPHDLTRDAPFTKMNLVLCRNVLIYMQPELQQRVLTMLHFALSQHGMLFLGAAESVGDLQAEFRTVNQKAKIFEKRRDVRLPLGRGQSVAGLLDPIGALKPGSSTLSNRSQLEMIATDVFGQYLRDHGAVALLIGRENQLSHVFGAPTRYVELPQGEQTWDITKLLPRDLVLPLTTALHRLRKDKESFDYSGVRVKFGDSSELVDMRIIRRKQTKGAAEGALVIIRPSQATRAAQTVEPIDADSEAAQHIRRLEEELQQTKENLQATIEELETTNEEQQASNEELLASNEELQSTNEELHSVNEELHTVNAEYQAKIRELTELNDDVNNLLRSTDIGTVFLDEELRIRKFTPAATNIINLMEHDIGRPIEHISSNFDDPDLLEHVRTVLKTHEPIEYVIRVRSGAALLLRIHAYRTESNEIRGVVLTFVDISELKAAEAKLQQTRDSLAEANERLTHLAAIVESSEDAIIGKSLDGIITTWNRGAEHLYGYSAAEAIGQPAANFLLTEAEQQFAEAMAAARRGDMTASLEAVRHAKDGKAVHVSINFSPIHDQDGNVIGISTISRNITARKDAEAAQHRLSTELEATAHELQVRNAALERANAEIESFVYSASHDLRAPLLNLQGFTDRLARGVGAVQEHLAACADEAPAPVQEAREVLEQHVTGPLRHIQVGVEKFGKVIDGLLQLSRTGRSELRPEYVDMRDLASDVVAVFARMIEENEAQVTVDPLPRAYADADAVHRILSNLVSNALKYRHRDRPPQIEIGAGPAEDGRQAYYVRDNGTGIDPRFHSKVFRMFERVNPQETTGEGLGLTIAKKLLDRHGGSISLASEPDIGTTVSFTLPTEPGVGHADPVRDDMGEL